MSEKKIEPTDAMVTSAHSAAVGRLMTDPMTYRRILRAALNHPDAAGLFADVDDRPWEPLNGPVRVGDEVRQDRPGTTITAVVGRVDEVGDPWATGGNFIGRLDFGTWYVRRHIQELPTKPGTFTVANGGHEYITATVDGVTYHARDAVFTQGEVWQGVWRSADGFLTAVHPENITPGTWKVEGE